MSAGGQRQCFAGLDALVPRVIKFDVTSTPAVSEPRTTDTTTTYFPRFRDDTAFWAYGTDGRHRGCWCIHVGIDQKTNEITRNQLLFGLRENLSTW